MGTHNIEKHLHEMESGTDYQILKTDAGFTLGAGSTVGGGVENWAPGAVYIDTDASQGAQVFVNTGTSTTATWTEIADAGVAAGFTLSEAANIVLGTTTGTKIGTATWQKLGFFNKAPVVQQTALTAVNATAIDATYDSVEQGVLNNVRTRVNDIETKLQALGLLA